MSTVSDKTFSGIFQTIYSFVSLVLPSEFHGCENFSIDTETLTLDVVITARRSYGNFGKKVRNLKLNSSKAVVTTAFVPKNMPTLVILPRNKNNPFATFNPFDTLLQLLGDAGHVELVGDGQGVLL